jgi:ribonuclease BN (tRNA processing enzyme)
MLKVKMIGTGSAFSKKFGNTSALVEFPSGYNLLLDCGHTVPKGLHDLNISLQDIDGIFISHLHADHVGGLEEVALYNKFVLGGRKIDLLVPLSLLKPLWDKCLRAGLESNGDGLSDYFNVLVMYTAAHSSTLSSIGDVPLTLFTTKHVEGMDSYAIGIGKDLFYSADTIFDISLINLAAKYYDAVFHDCQMSPASLTNVHASIEEMMTLPDEIQAKTYLMHYGDNVADFDCPEKRGWMEILEQGWTYVVGGKTK